MKYRPKHVVEFIALCGVVGLMKVIPYRAALSIGWAIAWISHRIVRFRAAEARRRIREVFGNQLADRDVDRIAWLSWRDFVFAMVDMMRLSKVTIEWLRDHLVNFEQARQAIHELRPKGKGAILACPHLGSSELGGVAMQRFDIPIFFITGRQKNPLVDAYLNRLRGSTGIATIGRGSSLLKGVIRRLKNGDVLGFQPDIRSSTEAVRVQFLGKEANVVGGMAMFARLAEVPILPSVITRDDWTRHRIKFLDPVVPNPDLDKQEDWQRMTQEVFSGIEKAIRAQPEQWFWYNKRWILDPLPPAEAGQDAEDSTSPEDAANQPPAGT